LAGTSEDDGTIACPRSAKKCRNLVRMSAAFMAELSSRRRAPARESQTGGLAKLLILRGFAGDCHTRRECRPGSGNAKTFRRNLQ
jgi:hypothetical protein